MQFIPLHMDYGFGLWWIPAHNELIEGHRQGQWQGWSGGVAGNDFPVPGR